MDGARACRAALVLSRTKEGFFRCSPPGAYKATDYARKKNVLST